MKEKSPLEGKHRRLYDEKLVQNIMLATAYYVKDLLEESPDFTDEDVFEFLEDNYKNIIEDTIDEFYNPEDSVDDNNDSNEDLNEI